MLCQCQEGCPGERVQMLPAACCKSVVHVASGCSRSHMCTASQQKSTCLLRGMPSKSRYHRRLVGEQPSPMEMITNLQP